MKEIKIGKVSVDSGCLLIGDPCYWLDNEGYGKEVIDSTWKNWREITHKGGIIGKGILANTGFGDGIYNVYAIIENKRVKEIKIKFF